MALLPLNMKTLAVLDDEKIAATFDTELEHLVRDCTERPHDERPRKLTIEFAITPDKEEDGMVHGDWKIKSTVPHRQTKRKEFNIRKVNGRPTLVFSENSEDDFRQTTLDDMDPETGRVDRPLRES